MTDPASNADHLLEAWAELTSEGAGFAMEEIEVRGIPMRVFGSAPASMRVLWELASLRGDTPYLVFEDEQLTYAEVDARVRALAHHLRDVHGVGPGDRVGLSMRNYPEWVVTYWATVSIGAAVVGMNAWWTGDEMAWALGDSAPKVVIVDGERLERLAPELAAVRADLGGLPVIATRVDGVEAPDGVDLWDEVVDPGAAPAGLPEASIDPDDDATIFYTSGTTGRPKGAQLTHRGSVHNILHLAFFTMAGGMAAAKDAPPADADDGDGGAAADGQLVYMAPTPLFHVTACNCLLHPCTLAGGRLVFLHRWDAGRALELIEREGVTNFSGVPTMARELVMHPDWATRDTSTLKGIAGGGAPVQPDLVDTIDERLKDSGGTPTTGYGLTETHGIITANTAAWYVAKPTSCGPVMPTFDAKLIGPEGDDLEPGHDTVGELCVRGPAVIKGYLNRPEATAEAIVDGWFRTGDIARIDADGFVHLLDRAKDMVLRGGENIGCAEVEAAIYAHEGVAEAAVFGVPEERLGEEVAAVVVARDGREIDVEELKAFVAERLAKHKVPTRVWVRDEALPQNANGKFLKRQLREEVLAEQATGA